MSCKCSVYLYVCGAASEVLWLRDPPGCSAVPLSAAPPLLLRLCRPHHHKVHTHLTRLNAHIQKTINDKANTQSTLLGRLRSLLVTLLLQYYHTFVSLYFIF